MRRERAAIERQIERARKDEEVLALQDSLLALVEFHQADFPPADHPTAELEATPDDAALRNRFEEEELRGIGIFARKNRRAARERAATRASAEAEALHRAALDRQRQAQAHLDLEWDALVANEPSTVMAALEAAFDDNVTPAVPLNCVGSTVTVLTLVKPLSFLPDRKPAVTDAGNLTTRKWAKTDRNEHYSVYVQSASFAAVKEAFAVAPGIKRVDLIVVRHAGSAGESQELEVLWTTSITRGNDAPPSPHDLPELAVSTSGRTKEVAAHDLDAYPELQALIGEISSQLREG